MKYRFLGDNRLKVSILCLGTMYFGRRSDTSNSIYIDEEDAFAILDTAQKNGINFIDTSDVYGSGASEEIIGKWLQSRGCRNNIVLGTKFGLLNSSEWESKGSRKFITNCLENSLRRLNTEYIDLYQIHIQNTAVEEEEILSVLQELVINGKILNYGASNYTAYRLAKSNCISDKLGYCGYTSFQAKYNIIDRSIEREHIPLLLNEGMGLLVWSPLAGGMLTGKYTNGNNFPMNSRYSKNRKMFIDLYDNSRCWNIVNVITAMQKELDVPSSVISLNWLLSQKVVYSIIIGISQKKQLLENILAVDYELPKLNLDRLNECISVDYGYPYDGIAKYSGMW